jgi:aryl-alcohol dehydrogenase-like predicted oxidoreductase
VRPILPSCYHLLTNNLPDARRHGLTPFSLYQGRWNAAFRDMESEIIPMCEDQGMAIVSWASLGGGHLVTAAQRKERDSDPSTGKGYYKASEDDIKVCDVLERIAIAKNATLQDIVCSTFPFSL